MQLRQPKNVVKVTQVFSQWYLYRGQASIPVGLKSADSLTQQEQNAGAGLYWAIWDEVPQGYRSSLPPHYKNYTIKITSGWLI